MTVTTTAGPRLDADLVRRYLERLGFDEPPAPTLAGLRELQSAHVLEVPFENLDYHDRREILLDPRVVSKIVDERRGGGCYELNPGFHYLLLELGFDSRILPGRSYVDGVLGEPYMHLVLEVVVDGAPYLVDTGFRRNPRGPLAVLEEGVQPDPHGEFRLEAVGDGQVDVLVDGALLYRFDRRGATIEDFAPTLWWWRTSPTSPFLQSIFCSRPTLDGRVSLVGDVLSVTTREGRTKQTLRTDAERLAAYRDHFGIVLDHVPSLHEQSGGGRTIRFEG